MAVDREETSANSTLLVRDGNASLTMMKLKVSDEGTYICTINSAPFQTQQIVQLNIIRECLASMWTCTISNMVKYLCSWDYLCEKQQFNNSLQWLSSVDADVLYFCLF